MKTHTDYKPSNDFGLLLIGPPLSGKTTVAMQFPRPYIISTDHKIKNAVERIPKGQPWYYDYVDIDDTGKPVDPINQWTRATDLLKKGCADPNVQTVIWDNLSDLSGILQTHIIANGGTKLTVGGEKVFEQQHWQPFKLLMQRSIAYARGSSKMFIVCCHESIERDEVTGMLIYQPLIPGQLKGQLGGFFTDVWRTEVEVVPNKPPRYYVRTVPTPRMSLGHSIAGLPPEFVFDWPTFSRLMSGSQKEPDKAAGAQK
jgi:hypothetical protein